jgi:hypothetical protein
MDSSISSSDGAVLDLATRHRAAFAGDRSESKPSATTERKTIRGLARPIPAIAWLPLLTATAVGVCVLIGAWEVWMRHLGLHAGDLDDGRDYWAVERRKVDSGPPDSIVLIGDSRILFDTDLATWQSLTGRRPIQLALPSSDAWPFLHDLAADEHFAGLVVIGTAELAYFEDQVDERDAVLDYFANESPSQRIGHQLYKEASRYAAFLDSDYTLFSLLERHRWPERPGIEGPYLDVWKISESYDDRQTQLWDRIEWDARLREHARLAWYSVYTGPAVNPDVIDRVIARTRPEVDRIRGRGGEVVWIRPPSSGPFLEAEERRYPRKTVWDRLVRETHSFGIYFDDYPSMQHLVIPEWSHLSRASALKFTDAYVRVLLENVAWLKSHRNDWLGATHPDGSRTTSARGSQAAHLQLN